jgi:hypothetical protein
LGPGEPSQREQRTPARRCNVNLKRRWNVANCNGQIADTAPPWAPSAAVWRERTATFYDAISLFQNQLTSEASQNNAVPSTNKQTSPKLEMIVGRWHLDEFGNPTREIKARD